MFPSVYDHFGTNGVIALLFDIQSYIHMHEDWHHIMASTICSLIYERGGTPES